MFRRFPGSRLALLVWLAAIPSADTVAAAPRKPNFVFIYTDDQRWDALGVVRREQGERGRFPWLETPNLDRLAAAGIRFRNAFVVNSLCSPSRATLLTGQYSHANGVVNNQEPHPSGNLSLPALLRPAGYASAYIGKWHHGRESGKRPGFDFSASFVGQGEYFDCPFEVDGVATPTTGFVDDVATDYAARFIRDHRADPFLLILGFKTCHKPFLPPPRRERDYEGERARRTPNLDTAAAKLIVYPGHDDWTEVFDLAADPYETRNLAADPAHAGLRKSLEAAYEEQSRAIGFHVPASVHTPPVDGVMPDGVKLTPPKKSRRTSASPTRP